MRRSLKNKPAAKGMTRYEGYVSIGLVGCKCTFEFEIESDAEERDIEDAAREAMIDAIEWGYTPTEQKA